MEDGALNNRELASLIWLGLGAALILCLPGRLKILRSAGSVLAMLASPKLLVPLIAYSCWLSGAIYIALQIGWWDVGLAAPTAIWVALSGLALFFSFDKAMRQERFFRSALLATVGASAFVEFFASFQSFPLAVELVAQPIVALMAMLSVVAKNQPEHKIVLKIAEWVMIGFALAAIAWTSWTLVTAWDQVDRGSAVRELLSPVWLTPIALAFVYFLALYAGYDQAFRRIEWKAKERSAWRQKAAYFSVVGPRLGRLRQLSGRVQLRAADAVTFSEARRIITDELPGRVGDEDDTGGACPRGPG